MEFYVDAIFRKIDCLNERKIHVEDASFIENADPILRRKFIAKFMKQ